MGLHATAYEHATLLDPHERGEACWESGHVLAHAYRAFERSTTGLVMGRCYEVGGATLGGAATRRHPERGASHPAGLAPDGVRR